MCILKGCVTCCFRIFDGFDGKSRQWYQPHAAFFIDQERNLIHEIDKNWTYPDIFFVLGYPLQMLEFNVQKSNVHTSFDLLLNLDLIYTHNLHTCLHTCLVSKSSCFAVKFQVSMTWQGSSAGLFYRGGEPQTLDASVTWSVNGQRCRRIGKRQLDHWDPVEPKCDHSTPVG